METNEAAIAARRRALAEALRTGEPVIVTATGEVEKKEDAQEQGLAGIQVPDGKLASQKEIPVFEPPVAPQFTPPVRTVRDGPSCYYHEDERAVARCARCGKLICQDCFDNYKVIDGEFAGKALCYDCCKAIVAENVELLKKNKTKITFTFAFTIIGMIIGAFFGLVATVNTGSELTGLFFGLCIGGCFWTFLKGWIARIGGAMAGGGYDIASFIIGLIVGFVIEAVLSVYRTIRKVIESVIYLKKTSGFIDSDTAALQQMADYMEYTLIRSQNKGVALETLLAQESNLADNTYAHMVHTQGEEQAEAHLRGVTATINEHGEIIRNFAA